MSRSGWDDNVDIPGGPQRQDVTFNRVSAGYFRTMQTPLLAGRDFNQTDTPQSPQVAIVNRSICPQIFRRCESIGKNIARFRSKDRTYQVVGLVKDSKYYELREDPVPIVFVSFTQANGPEDVSDADDSLG